MQDPRRDLTRTTLAVLFIVGLLLACIWILRPFLPALIWATMIVVATWTVMLRLQKFLWGRRALAVTVMTLALLLLFVAPFSAAIGTLVVNADEIGHWAENLGEIVLPHPPEWVQGLPFVGEKVAQTWREVATAGPEELAHKLQPYAGAVTRWFVSEVGSFGRMTLQFLLTVVIAAILYATGERGAGHVRRFAHRLAGSRGDEAVTLAGQAIRGVALGVVVTALAQSVLGGIGLAIAGVPFAAVLTALMFMLAVAQIGAVPVLLCGVVWLFWKDQTVWAIVLLVWTAVVGTLDNVLRPILIKKGANLPLLLIFSGVIGGLVAFGLIGIFIGPVVLAVGYTLLDAWAREKDEQATDA